jgi:hypothetical protein
MPGHAGLPVAGCSRRSWYRPFMNEIVDSVHISPNYELAFDGRVITFTQRWKHRSYTEKFDADLARWRLSEHRAGLRRDRRQVHFAISVPGTEGGGQVIIAEGDEAEALRAFADRVFRQAAGGRPEEAAVPAGWIPGRALVTEVSKAASADAVECTVTAAVRLADGTPLYRATFQATTIQRRADLLHAGRTLICVRADPRDHSRLVISWADDVPVVTVTDPGIIEPHARARRDGRACRVVLLSSSPQCLRTPAGEELYSSKARDARDGSETQVSLLVPPAATWLLTSGREVPARRLADQPDIIAVDWPAALAEAQAR